MPSWAEAAIVIELRRIVYRLDALRIAVESQKDETPALAALAARLDAEREKLAQALADNSDPTQ